MSTRPLMEVEGFRELQEKLKALASDRQKFTEIIKVLRKAAQGTVRVARQNVPVSRKAHVVSGKRTKKTLPPGTLKKALGVISGRRNSGNPVVYVGPRAKGNWDGFYGAFVEYGHNIYRTGFRRKRSASSRARRFNATGATGRTKPNVYMKRTYSQTKAQVTAETVNSVTKYIQKRIDALSK